MSTTLQPQYLIESGVSDDSAFFLSSPAPTSGTVTYYVYSGPNCTGTKTQLGSPVTVPPSGIVPSSAKFNATEPGNYYFSASYSGNPNNTPADSRCEVLTVYPATTISSSTTSSTMSSTTSSTTPTSSTSNDDALIGVGVVVVVVAAGGGLIVLRRQRGTTGTTSPPPPPPPPPPPTNTTIAAPVDVAFSPCPPGTPPKTETVCSCTVELYIPSMARVEVGGVYEAGVEDIDAALDGLEVALTTASVATGLLGAVTDPVASIAGSVGAAVNMIPGVNVGTNPDDITGKPTDAAMNGLKRLGGYLKQLRKSGDMQITTPKARFTFSCQITKECRDGRWVVTDRSLKLKKLPDKLNPDIFPDPPVQVTWQKSASGNQEIDHVMGMYATRMRQLNASAQKQMLECENACQSAE